MDCFLPCCLLLVVGEHQTSEMVIYLYNKLPVNHLNCRHVISEAYNKVSIPLTIGASRLMEAQLDLSRLLFGIGFQIFIVTLQMFMFSREYVENMQG